MYGALSYNRCGYNVDGGGSGPESALEVGVDWAFDGGGTDTTTGSFGMISCLTDCSFQHGSVVDAGVGVADSGGQLSVCISMTRKRQFWFELVRSQFWQRCKISLGMGRIHGLFPDGRRKLSDN